MTIAADDKEAPRGSGITIQRDRSRDHFVFATPSGGAFGGIGVATQ
jgi:hypothetical protein